MKHSSSPLAQMIIAEAESVVGNLQQALQDTKPRVLERDFVNHYLPILTARNLLDANGKVVKVDLNHWMEVAGNAFNPVDVVDDRGVVLFEVPPINRPGETIYPAPRQPTMGDIGGLNLKMLENNPRGSVTFLTEQYFTRYGRHEVTKDLETWIGILKRYNMLDHYLGNHGPVNNQTVLESTASVKDPFVESSGDWDDF